MILSLDQWALALVAAVCVGIAKAGFTGTSLISVALFTELFGARQQAGFALPLLILADLLVYPAFRKHGSWKEVWKLLPATLLGVAAGWWGMGVMDDQLAKRLIGSLILLLLVMQLMRIIRPELQRQWAEHRVFGTGAGVASGVTTMLANAAGPVFQLYLMSRHLPKLEMMGIGARFFLLVNLLKVPLNQSLGFITMETIRLDLCLAPAVLIGVLGGKWLLGKVSQKLFECIVMGSALLAAIKLLVVN